MDNTEDVGGHKKDTAENDDQLPDGKDSVGTEDGKECGGERGI